MTITASGLAGFTLWEIATTGTRVVGSVTAGRRVRVAVWYWSNGSDDPLVAGDLTKSAGTATIGTPLLDRQDGGSIGGGAFIRTAIFSVPVTGSGTLTLLLSSLNAGSYGGIGTEEFSSTQGWDDTPIVLTGALDAGDTLTSHSSGNVTTTGPAMFFAALSWNTGINAGLALTGTPAWVSVGIESDGTLHEPGAGAYQIATFGVTTAARWTGAMDAGADDGAVSTIVGWREAAGPLATAFQGDAFQQDAFQLYGGNVGPAAGSHPTSGALAADAATIAGTAAHRTLHATSGALAASAATLAGVAAHRTRHATTGALTAAAATIAGTAAHHHATTGALAASAATLAGTAAHLTLHATSGALVSGAATIAGSAAHHHATTGALAASAATIAGTATHTAGGAAHPTSGALSADAATIAGTAAHRTLHATSGALLAQAATLAGTAAHFTLHATSGALVSGAATIDGVASHNVTHETSGALQAASATISGVAQVGEQILVIDTHDGAPKRDRQHKKKQEERRRAIEEAVNPPKPVPEIQAPAPEFKPIAPKAQESALTSDNSADFEADDEAQILTMLAQIEDQALADFLDELSRRIRSIRPRGVRGR